MGAPLRAFVRHVSGMDLDVLDTSGVPFLAGRHKPDLTFVLRFLLDALGRLVCDMTELQAVDVGEAKGKGVNVDTDAVKGQGAVYGDELGQSRPLGGPVTVPLVSPSGLMFVRVDTPTRRLEETLVFAWVDDNVPEGALCPLVAFILESTARAQDRTALTRLVDDYVLVRRLGMGASSTVYEAVCTGGTGSEGGARGGVGAGAGAGAGSCASLRNVAVKVFADGSGAGDVGIRCAVEALVLSPGKNGLFPVSQMSMRELA